MKQLIISLAMICCSLTSSGQAAVSIIGNQYENLRDLSKKVSKSLQISGNVLEVYRGTKQTVKLHNQLIKMVNDWKNLTYSKKIKKKNWDLYLDVYSSILIASDKVLKGFLKFVDRKAKSVSASITDANKGTKDINDDLDQIEAEIKAVNNQFKELISFARKYFIVFTTIESHERLLEFATTKEFDKHFDFFDLRRENKK